MNYARQRWLILLALLFLIMPAVNCWAVPQMINYQGMLTDSSGNPVSDPSLDMQFAVYAAASGGSALWSEIQSVEVVDGVFNVQLGTAPPFPAGLFDDNTYLEITINPPGTEMTPRHALVSVPYSFKAENADALGGYAADAFSLTGHTHNDLYYLKSEIDSLLLGKAASDHDHSGGDIVSGTVADVRIADTITRDSELAGKADIVHVHSGEDITGGTVADAYIAATITRNSELSAGLAGKSDTGHTHDTRYYTEAEVDSLITGLNNLITAQDARLAALETLLTHFSRSDNEITISGANLHINNSTGTTEGTVNGLGNLIVGYNELRGSGDDRSGSHNIVVGRKHNYSNYGGLVVGDENTISASYATVSGGFHNIASGLRASVSGGVHNTASGVSASVSGGYYNLATNYRASVSGGARNTASGVESSVSGGEYNTASGNYASVAGGGGPNNYEGNVAFANHSSVLGGSTNGTGDVTRVWNSGGEYYEIIPGTDHSIGIQSTVSSGYANIASGEVASISGGYYNTASSTFTSVSGGKSNVASGSFTSVSGGHNNLASDYYSSVSGGVHNTASGNSASVSGGQFNVASGTYASVSGGANNTASTWNSSVSGGSSNTASSNSASVSGGTYNTANGSYASISGGRYNTASGYAASVAGGGGQNAYEGNIAFANYSAILGGSTNGTGDVVRSYNTGGNYWELITGTDYDIGIQSTVSSGYVNIARGEQATVSGGYARTVSGQWDWRAGTLFEDF